MGALKDPSAARVKAGMGEKSSKKGTNLTTIRHCQLPRKFIQQEWELVEVVSSVV